MSQPLIYQRVRLCANLLWSDLATGWGRSVKPNRVAVRLR